MFGYTFPDDGASSQVLSSTCWSFLFVAEDECVERDIGVVLGESPELWLEEGLGPRW